MYDRLFFERKTQLTVENIIVKRYLNYFLITGTHIRNPFGTPPF